MSLIIRGSPVWAYDRDQIQTGYVDRMEELLHETPQYGVLLAEITHNYPRYRIYGRINPTPSGPEVWIATHACELTPINGVPLYIVTRCWQSYQLFVRTAWPGEMVTNWSQARRTNHFECLAFPVYYPPAYMRSRYATHHGNMGTMVASERGIISYYYDHRTPMTTMNVELVEEEEEEEEEESEESEY
jgi:hypothetical protein